MACVGNRRVPYRVLVSNLREMGNLEDLGLENKIIIKWTFKK
jgi:hypothetical protein